VDRHEGYERWMSLSEASSLLGVHASTLRRWADSGRVPCQRTPGGHRRFNKQQLLPLLEGSGFEEQQVEPGPPDEQPWHSVFADSGMIEEMRSLGQRISGVFVQYLMRSDADERLRADAYELGRQYGRQAMAAGADLTTAVKAYLYFRASVSDLAAPTVGAETSTYMRSFNRYQEVAGDVLVGLIQEYEAAG